MATVHSQALVVLLAIEIVEYGDGRRVLIRNTTLTITAVAVVDGRAATAQLRFAETSAVMEEHASVRTHAAVQYTIRDRSAKQRSHAKEKKWNYFFFLIHLEVLDRNISVLLRTSFKM